jgi:hypothetical protein
MKTNYNHVCWSDGVIFPVGAGSSVFYVTRGFTLLVMLRKSI